MNNLSQITIAIAQSRQQIAKRLTYLSQAVIEAAQALADADKAGKKDARAALKAEQNRLLGTLANELTQAMADAKQYCADAQTIADAADADEVAASWDWHSGAEARRVRNALSYVIKCCKDETGLVIAYNRAEEKYTCAAPVAGKAPTPKSSKPKQSNGANAAPIAQGNAEGEQKPQGLQENEVRVERTEFTLETIAENREAVLLALAQAYGNKAAFLAAVKELQESAFCPADDVKKVG